MRRGVVGALVAVLAVAAAGCGGQKGLSQADFVRRADATCKHGKEQMTALLRTPEAARAVRTNPRELSEIVLRGLASQRQMIKQLDAIKPPDALVSGYQAYVAAIRTENDLSQQVVSRAHADPGFGQGSVALTERRVNLSHKAVRLAKAVGLRVCGGAG